MAADSVAVGYMAEAAATGKPDRSKWGGFLAASLSQVVIHGRNGDNST